MAFIVKYVAAECIHVGFSLCLSTAQQSILAGMLVVLRLPTQTKKFIDSISHFSIK